MRAILTYHSIDSSGSAISIAEPDFRRHVEWLGQGHVQVLPLHEIAGARSGSDAIALTFDDAFENFRTTALPLLEQHNIPCTLFVATKHVGRTNAWAAPVGAGKIPTHPLLDWKDLRDVAGRGVAIGSHCQTHRPLTSLDDAALRDELTQSADEIERELTTRPTCVAYPFGSASVRERNAASRVYQLGVGTDFRFLGDNDDRLLLPRLDAYYLREPDRLESFGTKKFERFLKLRRGGRALRASVTRVLGRGDG